MVENLSYLPLPFKPLKTVKKMFLTTKVAAVKIDWISRLSTSSRGVLKQKISQ